MSILPERRVAFFRFSVMVENGIFSVVVIVVLVIVIVGGWFIVLVFGFVGVNVFVHMLLRCSCKKLLG